MHLHSYHNEETQKNFWANLTKIPKTQFNKTFLKLNTKKRIRENYPGYATIYYYDNKLAKELTSIYEVFIENLENRNKMGAW